MGSLWTSLCGRENSQTDVEALRGNEYTSWSNPSDSIELGVDDASTDSLPHNKYETFKYRHVVRTDQMPECEDGWNSLMHERGLMHKRDLNTFIVDSSYSDNMFTQPTSMGFYESNRPLEIVDLKKNKHTGKYEVNFRSKAFVEVSRDANKRPVHLEGYRKW